MSRKGRGRMKRKDILKELETMIERARKVGEEEEAKFAGLYYPSAYGTLIARIEFLAEEIRKEE